MQETNGLGRLLAYAYDDRGNLASVAWPDNLCVMFATARLVKVLCQCRIMWSWISAGRARDGDSLLCISVFERG